MRARRLSISRFGLAVCGLASLSPVLAQISLVDRDLTIATRTLSMTFRGSSLTAFNNKLTGENYIGRASDVVLGLSMIENPATTMQLSAWRVETVEGKQQAILVSSDSVRRVQLAVEVDGDDIVCRVDGGASRPGVISLTWALGGLTLQDNRIIAPSQAGMYYNLTSRIDDLDGSMADDYPVHWESQFVFYESSKGGGFSVSARDKAFNFKRMHGSREPGSLVLGFEMFAPGPWPAADTVAPIEWRIHGHSGNWKDAANRHSQWVETVLPTMPSPPSHAWANEIRGVVTVQTLDPAILDLLAKTLDPKKTLLSMIDWRLAGYDLNYPDYRAHPNAKAFIEQARKLGFRVMLHTNLLGISTTHPAYESMRKYQIRTADSLRPTGWLWDDLPEGSPRRFAYISPAAKEFRDLLLTRLAEGVAELEPDGIHLDAGGGISNDGNGLVDGANTIQGLIQLHREIRERFPNLVLSGESTNEATAPFLRFAQRWTARTPSHPVSTFVFGPRVTFYGFLDQPNPDDAGFADYVQRYEGQDVLPTPIISSVEDLAPDRVRMQRLLTTIRKFQDHQFVPDWDTPWSENEIFRYRSPQGAATAVVEKVGSLVILRVDEEEIYERVSDVTELKTPFFIDSWSAWDEEGLYGLDPARQYWLDPTPYRPSERLRIEKLDPRLTIGLNSFSTPDYGLFDFGVLERTPFNFLSEFESAKRGTQYNRQDFPMINGATASITRIFVNSRISKNIVFMAPPFRGTLGGATFVEYSVPVPVSNSVDLTFECALSDGAGRSDGAWMAVWIDGSEVWREMVTIGRWQPGRISLTRFAGKTVKLRLITHPGPSNNPRDDWSAWSGLQIETGKTVPYVSLGLRRAPGATAKISSTDAVVESDGGEAATVRFDAPGSIAVFAKPPADAAPGQDLLDLPFDTWRQGYGGLPRIASYENSGTIRRAIVGGEAIDKTVVARPPRNGTTVLTWPLRIPEEASHLALRVGLSEPPPEFAASVDYTGVVVSVQVGNKTVWSEELRTSRWVPAIIDLKPWRGKEIVLKLISDSLTTAVFDWVHWADLKVN